MAQAPIFKSLGAPDARADLIRQRRSEALALNLQLFGGRSTAAQTGAIFGTILGNKLNPMQLSAADERQLRIQESASQLQTARMKDPEFKKKDFEDQQLAYLDDLAQ